MFDRGVYTSRLSSPLQELQPSMLRLWLDACMRVQKYQDWWHSIQAAGHTPEVLKSCCQAASHQIAKDLESLQRYLRAQWMMSLTWCVCEVVAHYAGN